MRRAITLLVLSLCSCGTVPEIENSGPNWHAERIRYNIEGLEDSEQMILEELNFLAPKDPLFQPSWEERLLVYKHSCAFYRLRMLEQVQHRCDSYNHGLITEQEFEALVQQDLERLLPSYLRALMVNGVRSSLLRSMIEIHVSNLSRAVKSDAHLERNDE